MISRGDLGGEEMVDRLPAVDTIIERVPVGDMGFADPPAEEDEVVVTQGVEVDEPGVDPLRHAADRLELDEEFRHPLREERHLPLGPLGVAAD